MQAAQAQRERLMQQQTYLNSAQTQMNNASDTAMAPQSIDSQLDNARANLASLEARYTPDHPDVKKLKETIASLEKLKKDMANEARDQVESGESPQAVGQGQCLGQPEDPDEDEPARVGVDQRADAASGAGCPGLSGSAWMPRRPSKRKRST